MINNRVDDDDDIDPHDEIAHDQTQAQADNDDQCWRLIKQCEWVTYNTVCANKPITTCKVSNTQIIDNCFSNKGNQFCGLLANLVRPSSDKGNKRNLSTCQLVTRL